MRANLGSKDVIDLTGDSDSEKSSEEDARAVVVDVLPSMSPMYPTSPTKLQRLPDHPFRSPAKTQPPKPPVTVSPATSDPPNKSTPLTRPPLVLSNPSTRTPTPVHPMTVKRSPIPLPYNVRHLSGTSSDVGPKKATTSMVPNANSLSSTTTSRSVSPSKSLKRTPVPLPPSTGYTPLNTSYLPLYVSKDAGGGAQQAEKRRKVGAVVDLGEPGPSLQASAPKQPSFDGGNVQSQGNGVFAQTVSSTNGNSFKAIGPTPPQKGTSHIGAFSAQGVMRIDVSQSRAQLGQKTNSGRSEKEPWMPRWWTGDEIHDLLAGVARFGKGRWKEILNCPDYSFHHRTAGNLKDKYRSLGARKQSPLSAPQPTVAKEQNSSVNSQPKPRVRRFNKGDEYSVSSLNLALKNVNTVSLADDDDDILASKGRPLFIARASPEESNHAREDGQSLAKGTDIVENARQTAGSSDVDAGTDVWSLINDESERTDTDSILHSFKARKMPIEKGSARHTSVANFGIPSRDVHTHDELGETSGDEMEEYSGDERDIAANASDVDSIMQVFDSREPSLAEETNSSDLDLGSQLAGVRSPFESVDSPGTKDCDIAIITDTDAILRSFKSRKAPAAEKPTSTAPVRMSSGNTVENTGGDNWDRDSVIVVSSSPITTPRSPSPHSSPPHRRQQSAIETEGFKKRWFKEEDDHLLIYLKEHRGLPWSEIGKYFHDRTVGTLKCHYCTKVNPRNKKNDPSRAELDTKFGSLEPGAKAISPQPRFQTGEVAHRRRDSRLHGKDTTHNTETVTVGRPRRNVQTVDYTIYGMRGQKVDDNPDHQDDDHDDHDDHDDDSVMTTKDQSHPSESPIREEYALPLEPMVIDDRADALLATSTTSKPYLSSKQRAVPRLGANDFDWAPSSRDWQGTLLHVDFTEEELDHVERAIWKVCGGLSESKSRRKRFQIALRGQPEPKLLQLAYEIRRYVGKHRDRQSIDAFIEDARNGMISRVPHIERLAAARPRTLFDVSARNTSTTRLVLDRELGLQSRRGCKSASRTLTYQVRNKLYDTLGPTFSYTGASSDVHTVAWSPDGQYFAAGAVCVTDNDSMQYNRPNNLLYGSLNDQSIQELAGHKTRRERTESGPNSTHEMFVSQDPDIFHTVTQVAFSLDGDYMFSASYDKKVIVWRTKDDADQPLSHPTSVCELKHAEKVDLMTVNPDNVLATATRKGSKPVKVCRFEDGLNEGVLDLKGRPVTLSSKKADERPDLNMLPTALKFQPTHGALLLAAFGANKSEEGLDTNGDICVFDVETGTELSKHGLGKNVFDVDWSPSHEYCFAAGCVAGKNVNRGTRSIVTLYDYRATGAGTKYCLWGELECPAFDMNEVQFCPYDSFFIAAGCTSGDTYVWDLRMHDRYLYKLSHGKSLMPLDPDISAEKCDTGVRFLSWGETSSRLYTGSSDGMVKVWDVMHNQKDAFVKNLVTVDSGVMSGAFTKDFSKLIIGEVNGSLNVLEVGNDDRTVKDMEQLTYCPDLYDGDQGSSFMSSDASIIAVEESGRSIAQRMLSNKEMIVVPYGEFPKRQAVQGPNYMGPFDFRSEDAPKGREKAFHFQTKLRTEMGGQQCNLPGCKDAVTKTSEEIGDSGRSEDRIPDELRRQFLNLGLKKMPLGKAKCKCGRPARPGENAEEQVCERCNFACFRCGGRCRVKPGTEWLVCEECFRAWEAGALGYECVEDTRCSALTVDVPMLRDESIGAAGDNDGHGNGINALTEFYLRLGVCD